MAIETVAVIGGGIGGLASAILLSEKGFQVTVFDKAKSPQPVGAGFLLQPPGQCILDALGVLSEVRKDAVPITGLQSRTVSGHTVLNLDYHRLKGSPRSGLGVQRSTIYDAMLGKATQSDNITFVWDAHVEQCLTRDDNVCVIANDVQTRFDLCILSSGSKSPLAESHFPARTKKSYGWGCLWTTIDLPSGLSPHILHQRCQNANKMMGILPVRKRGTSYESALYWSMKTQELDQFNEGQFAALKKEIGQFWPGVQDSLEPLEYPDMISAYYNDIWTPKPFTNRLIAIGDVSHATSPQLGQGCTMALLDAWSLANHLEIKTENLSEALEKWWRSRRNQLAYVRLLSKFLTPLFQSDNRSNSWFRDWFMAPAGRLPVFDTLQLKTLASEIFLGDVSQDS